MKRILIVGSQHGNELLGEQLYAYITSKEPDLAKHVAYKLANPQAWAKNVRFIESDMNRSYATGNKTYEAQLATDMLAYLQAQRYDLVLDTHTTTVRQQPCVIVPNLNQNIGLFLRASHIREVVLMEHYFREQSLIGTADNAVSVEVSVSHLGDALYARIAEDLKLCIAGTAPVVTKNLYTVRQLLPRGAVSANDAKTIQNFRPLADGTYPVLVGEEAYRQHTDYLGFLAQTKQIIKV